MGQYGGFVIVGALTAAGISVMFFAGRGAQIAGAGLIVSGGSSLIAAGMQAAGSYSKLASAECFIAGTLILCKDEEGNEIHKKIEDIQEGDLVYAYDEETGVSDWKPVSQVFRNSTQVTHHLCFDDSNEPIVCTPDHPFYILNAGSDTSIVKFEGCDKSKFAGQWVQAKYLKVGDKVLQSSGKTAILTISELEHLSELITTYNFEVAEFHTYYVGEQGILVHNACPKIQTGDTKDFSVHKSRRAAYRAARRDAGVLQQRPTNVGPAYNRQGHWMPGKTYTFG